MSSFHVDGRVSVRLEYDLAMRLGEFILSSGTEDKQFLALGHKLLNIDEDDQKPMMNKRHDFYQEKEVIRSTGRVLNEAANSPENWEDEQKPPIRIRSKYSRNI